MQATLKDGQKVLVRIQHNHVDEQEQIQQVLKGQRPTLAFTEAKVTFSDGREYTGVAKCAMGDQFRRRFGLSKSLARALEKSGMDRENRTIVWGRIFNNKFTTK